MMKAYNKYIDSGVDWVGYIPEDWRFTRLKYISSISKGKKAKEDYQDFQEGMIPYLSMEYLRSQTESPSYVNVDDPNIVLVDEQDLLILWDGSKAGEIVKAKNGALSSTMGKIHLDSDLFELNFLAYYLKNAERFIQANTVGMGIPHISGEILRTLFIAFPKKETQTQIARFLDHQTAIIDELIQRKEKQIELLKEKRQSIINEVVTKGLNPNVKMKDSGIEWLGEVPEHWKSTRMKFIASLKGRQGWQGLKADEYKDSGPYVVSSVHFNNYKIDWENCPRVSQERYERDENIQLNQGDVLLMKDGANMGKLAMVEYLPGPACLNSHLLLFRPLFINEAPSFYQKYLFYHMNCDFFQDYIYKNGTGSTFSGISQQSIGNYSIILPPLNEQIEIANYIDGSTRQIDNIIREELKQITLLNEYRTALISESVTGKIDVRDWEPKSGN